MTTKRRTFDLETEARRLYRTARAKEDFTGAASVLRLLRDLRPSSGDAAPMDRWVEWATADEMNMLQAAFASIDAVERVAKARRDLGGAPPQAHLVGPIEAQTWRQTPETVAERMARPIPSSQDAPIVDAAPVESPLDENDEDEIDVSDLIEEGFDLSWIPDEEPS